MTLYQHFKFFSMDLCILKLPIKLWHKKLSQSMDQINVYNLNNLSVLYLKIK
jgi:hypothetical protein